MSSEGQRIWSIKIGCATSSINTSSFNPSDDFTDILTPLILIRQLTHYDSHTALRQYPTSHRVKSSDQVIFPFYLDFPMMSHCVSFYYSFLFDLSSDSSCCSEKELSGISSDSLMSNCLLISEMLLSHSAFPSCI